MVGDEPIWREILRFKVNDVTETSDAFFRAAA